MLDLTLRDLEYVREIALRRNITQAAAELHMAQPALSQSLQRIERRLGVRLFVRTSRQVTPTPAGVELAEAADRILSDVRRATVRAQVAGGLPEPLRVHVNEPSLVTPRRILAAVRAHVPSAAVHQSTLPERDVADALLSGELTLAIGGPFHGGDLTSFRVREERLGVLVGAAHPLARRPSVTAGDLAAYPMLSVEPTMSSWDAWVSSLLAASGVEIRWTKGATFGLSAGGDVLHDQRTTLMTLESVAREYLDGLVWLALEPVRRVPWFVTHRARSLRDSPATDAAVRVIRRLADDQGWTAGLRPRPVPH